VISRLNTVTPGRRIIEVLIQFGVEITSPLYIELSRSSTDSGSEIVAGQHSHSRGHSGLLVVCLVRF